MRNRVLINAVSLPRDFKPSTSDLGPVTKQLDQMMVERGEIL
jgi:hypothetical protein